MTVAELIAKHRTYADDLEVVTETVNCMDGDVTYDEPDFYVLNIEPPEKPFRWEVREGQAGARVGALVLR